MRAYYISEKFTQDSDPVFDLGIGLKQHLKSVWENSLSKIDNTDLVLDKYDPGVDKDNVVNIMGAKIFFIFVKLIVESEKTLVDSSLIEECLTKINEIYDLKDKPHYKKRAADIIYKNFNIKIDESLLESVNKKNNKDMRAKTIKEEAMGGVSLPCANLNNVPGMGNVTPGTITSFGSGDKWDNTIGGKPYTQAKPIKANKKKTRKRKRRVNEENTNPYDQIANMMIKRMGKETKSPFKKKKSKKNQNVVVQRKFEHEIATFDQYLNEIYTADLQNIPEELDIINEFKDLFREKYPYISIDLVNQTIIKFLAQKHINSLSIERAVDLFADYVLSQGLADGVDE